MPPKVVAINHNPAPDDDGRQQDPPGSAVNDTGDTAEASARANSDHTLRSLLEGRGASARLEMMLETTRLGEMTLGDFHQDRPGVVSWMLQQRNCGRKTANELARMMASHPRPAMPPEPPAPDPPLPDVQLHELLAADNLSARLLEAVRTTELRTMPLAEYIKRMAEIESRLLRLPNFGRKSAGELRGLVGTHVRRYMEALDLDPPAFGRGFAAFVAAAPMTVPEAVGPPAGCDLQTLLSWHLKRLTETRTADILALRFGLGGDRPKTLQEIGDLYGITRERIRQLEVKGLKSLRAACRRFSVRPLVDTATPSLLQEVFAGGRHAISQRAERAIASLDGWTDLALCLTHGGAAEWLAASATRLGEGWLDPTADPDAVTAVADALRRRTAGKPFPRSEIELYGGADPASASAAMDLLLGWRVEAGYVFERRPGPRLRRMAVLHASLSEAGAPLEMVPLLRRYHAVAPADRCTDRDLVIVMEAAPHLFLEIHEGCWTAIGSAAPLRPAEEAGEEPERTPYSNELDEATNASALERELERTGPCRMGELMARAIDILPEGRSRHSVGPTLLTNPSRFTRVLPGVYALPHQVLDGRDLVHAGSVAYLLNPTQARYYAVGRKSGEHWGAFPLWTPTAEMRLCRWARSGDDGPLYRSLLDVASIDDWPTDASDRDVWRDLKAREGRFELWSEPRLSGARPPVDRVLAAAVRLAGSGSLGWVAANRILGYVPSSYAGAGLLVGMAAAGMAVERDDPSAWQLPHDPGPRLEYWIERLTDHLHDSGAIDWHTGAGAELASAFGAQADGGDAPVDEPEEMDEFERIMAEHRRSLHARRIEARLELEAE